MDGGRSLNFLVLPTRRVSDSDILIVGGGPAGVMAGLLFARAGVNVRILEKHADFFRDFRGDTVHPSTMEILDQLGLARALPRAAARRARYRPHPRRRNRIYHRRSFAPRHTRAVHRDDAAMGIPRFPARRGRDLSRIFADDGAAGRRLHRGGRAHRRGPPQGRQGASRRQIGDRRRRALFAGPPPRDAPGRGARRADGRVLVQPAQDRRSRRRAARLGRDRTDGRADRPPDLLAMRLPHSQGQRRGGQGARRRMVSKRGSEGLPRLGFFRRGRAEIDRRSAPARSRARPADPLASARPAGDRRCGARHVADRRHRHQPRHPGRGRRGQHPRRAARRGQRGR